MNSHKVLADISQLSSKATPVQLAASYVAVLLEQLGHDREIFSDSSLPLANQLGEAEPDIETQLAKYAKAVVAESANPATISASVGVLYQSLLGSHRRKKRGTHLTPSDVGTELVRCLEQSRNDRPARTQLNQTFSILDPAVGGAALLLAAAQYFLTEILNNQREANSGETDIALSYAIRLAHGLIGYDIDAASVMIAQSAVALWVVQYGGEFCEYGKFSQADSLTIDLPQADLVIANPPFLSRLKSQTALDKKRRDEIDKRWKKYRRPYTDEAALFLVACVEALKDGAALCVIMPVSILSSKDTAEIRKRIEEKLRLYGIWIAGEKIFGDASVQVCAVIAARDKTPPEHVTCWHGRDFKKIELKRGDIGQRLTWSQIAAVSTGVPLIDIAQRTKTLADIAHVTAGFRDQFYGLIPFTREATEPEIAALGRGEANQLMRVITTGMIDPLENKWGTSQFRFAKKLWHHPVVDLEALETGDPNLSRWVTERRKPKLMVATQTRVIEVEHDRYGQDIPVTPTITVEPHKTQDIATALAVLSHPQISAWLYQTCFGSAMSLDAIKVNASLLAGLAVPTLSAQTQTAIIAAEAKMSATDFAKFVAEHVEIQTPTKQPSGQHNENAAYRWWSERIH